MKKINRIVLKEEKTKFLQKCLEDEPPSCSTVCPFGLDICKFTEKIKQGNFNAALRLFRDYVAFPMIAEALCDAPCTISCAKNICNKPVNIKLLEKACLQYAKIKGPTGYNIPNKSKSVAIIGAGISGLSCALKLSRKKYDVTVYEKSERIGGNLWSLIPENKFLEEIEEQFSLENWKLVLNEKILNVETLKFDAVYVATGKLEHPYDLIIKDYEVDNTGFATSKEGIFAGGELRGVTPIEAMAHGIRAANYIESFLKTQNVSYSDKANTRNVEVDEDKLYCSTEPVIPLNGLTFSEEEAKREAGRCIRCRCDACIHNCDLMQFYKKMPVKISEDAAATAGLDGVRGEIKTAVKLIATCSQCGLCNEKCPENIDTGNFLLNARIEMFNKSALPWAYHDFQLRDMINANGESSCLRIKPRVTNTASHLLFTGCQLGASDPEYVAATYNYLLKAFPNLALMTDCCGVPALWAGDVKVFDEALKRINEYWIEIGKPIIIFACTTCQKILEEYLPIVKSISLYELLNKTGICITNKKSGSFSVFDPCGARNREGVHIAVRELIKDCCELSPLRYERNNARCCGFGGHTLVANPSYTKEVTKKRIEQSPNTYITYCTNCRDIFAREGKKSLHLLDVLFNIHNETWAPPNISEKRRNREKLKECTSNENGFLIIKNYDYEKNTSKNSIKHKVTNKILVIQEALKEKLNNELILEENIEEVVNFCEAEGLKIYDEERKHYFGYKKIGYMTYWIEYKTDKMLIEVINAYAHRMSVEEE